MLDTVAERSPPLRPSSKEEGESRKLPAAEAAQDQVFCVVGDKGGEGMGFDHGFILIVIPLND